MPRHEAAAGLHRRQDAHHARPIAALFQSLLHPVFLRETIPAPYELDRDGIFGGDSLEFLAKCIA
jgi:hypothetical protein